MIRPFRVHFDDFSSIVVFAADPAEARKLARARSARPIVKIKLDRAEVEPHRAPRLTRRQIEGTTP